MYQLKLYVHTIGKACKYIGNIFCMVVSNVGLMVLSYGDTNLNCGQIGNAL